jgi:predicted PurR-regulated permease PerM
MQSSKLFRTVLILLLFITTGIVLVYGKTFLAPVAFAVILSLFLYPITRWLERKGASKVLASMGAVLALLAAIALLFTLLGWQLSDLAKDSHQIEKQLNQKISETKTWLAESMGIPKEKQQQMMQEQQKSSGGISKTITGLVAGFGGFLTDFLLIIIYIFLIIYFRRHFVNFILRLVPTGKQAETETVIRSSQEAISKYFTGLALMIVGLWIMYAIGFTLVGVKAPIFFAMLCGTLEIIPFVGNLAGTAITMLMTIGQGGSMTMLIWIAIVYAVVQFIQSYILEPLVVGKEVSINPFFTIAGIVAGEALWGIPGMILAIPTLAIFKIVCDHVDPLKPYGYLIGDEKEKKKSSSKKG